MQQLHQTRIAPFYLISLLFIIIAKTPAVASTPTKFTAAQENTKAIFDLTSLTLEYTAEQAAIFPLGEPIGEFQIYGQSLEITCVVGKVRVGTEITGEINAKSQRFSLQPTNRQLPFPILHDLPGCTMERIWNYADKKGPFPQSNVETIPMLPMGKPDYFQKSKLVGKNWGTILTIEGAKATLDNSKNSAGAWTISDNMRLTLLCNLPDGRAVGQAVGIGNTQIAVFNLSKLPLATTQAKSTCEVLDNQALIQPEFGVQTKFKMRPSIVPRR
jgi:hypothetical protein